MCEGEGWSLDVCMCVCVSGGVHVREKENYVRVYVHEDYINK